MADLQQPSMASALHEGATYNGLFPSFLAFLRDTHNATLLVFEDVHWADAGTLDFIRYVGRRLTGVPVLMLLTYRDESVNHDHPLRRVMGERFQKLKSRETTAKYYGWRKCGLNKSLRQ